MARRSGFEQNRRKNVTIDWYTIGQDIKREWLTIVMIAVAVGLIVFGVSLIRYHKTFKEEAVFVVTASSNQNVYYNQSSASNVASTLTTLMGQRATREELAKAMETDSIPGDITATVVEETNLVTVTASASSAWDAHYLMKGFLDHYQEVFSSSLGNVHLNILISPEVQKKPDVPFSPARITAIGIIAGGILWIIFLIFLSISRDTICNERDITEKLDARHIGTIYHEKKHVSRRAKKTAILITKPTVSFRYSESVRRITSRIRSRMRHRDAKVLMVTSVLENEGKSSVAANIALALAEGGNRVIMLDCDFRKPALYKIFEVDKDEITNLGDVLRGNYDVSKLIHVMDQPKMQLIFNAKAYRDSSEIIVQGTLEKILQYLRQKADYIVLDTSPMALVADAEEIAQYADASVLVVRQNFALAGDINDCIDSLNRQKGKLIGIVFNDVGVDRFGAEKSSYGRYDKYGSYAEQSKKAAKAAQMGGEPDAE